MFDFQVRIAGHKATDLTLALNAAHSTQRVTDS